MGWDGEGGKVETRFLVVLRGYSMPTCERNEMITRSHLWCRVCAFFTSLCHFNQTSFLCALSDLPVSVCFEALSGHVGHISEHVILGYTHVSTCQQ
jgi:hypothetical protein